MNRRLIGAVVAATAVITAVVVIIAVSVVPFPGFTELAAGTFSGSLAFVGEDNCVHVADLGSAATTELRCESEQNRIERLEWTAQGIEATTYFNIPTTKVLDPGTGEVLETRSGEEMPEPVDRSGGELAVGWPEDGVIAIYDEQGDELLRLDAPERYRIESPMTSPDGDLIAFVDSVNRVAVFDRNGRGPYQVTDDASSWPPITWMP